MNLQCLIGKFRSLMYKMNSAGPKTDPCGTTVGIDAHSDLQSFIETNCCLSLRYASNHLLVIHQFQNNFKINQKINISH